MNKKYQSIYFLAGRFNRTTSEGLAKYNDKNLQRIDERCENQFSGPFVNNQGAKQNAIGNACL
jgi:hypothetical protein